jgi:hypothetical protein
VHTDERGVKMVSYTGLVGVLIEAVKELDARLEDLEARMGEDRRGRPDSGRGRVETPDHLT